MIALALAFFGLAALGLSLVCLKRAPLISRIGAITCIPPLAFAVWQAAQPPTGWPAHVKPPKLAQFLAGSVREPNAVEQDAGEIDLLLIPPSSPRPRLYRLPYSRQLHEQVQAAMRGTKRGVKVGVRVARNGPRTRFVFYRLPPPRPPAKN